MKLCLLNIVQTLFQHLQTMLKTKLNVLTLRKDPLPTVIFHEPEAIELCSTTPHNKNRAHTGYKVKNLRISAIKILRVDFGIFSDHDLNLNVVPPTFAEFHLPSFTPKF